MMFCSSQLCLAANDAAGARNTPTRARYTRRIVSTSQRGCEQLQVRLGASHKGTQPPSNCVESRSARGEPLRDAREQGPHWLLRPKANPSPLAALPVSPLPGRLAPQSPSESGWTKVATACLDLAHDRRDLATEALEKLADARVYLAATSARFRGTARRNPAASGRARTLSPTMGMLDR